MKDLPSSALEIADLLKKREVSSRELVGHYLHVMDLENPGLGSFVERNEKRALKEADQADARLAKREPRAPMFLGVPTGIKDHENLAGYFTRVGSRAYRWVYSPFDGAVARACRNAGFVFLGKLATSEMTILPFIDTDLHPPARNPRAPDRYAGGSSGGSAAAVAAGMLPIAPGSDGGGSVRIPASFCGLVGMKPARGTLPHPYSAVDKRKISSTGPLARDVRDAAALTDVLAERPAADGRKDSFLAACDEPVPAGLRIALLTKTPLTETEPEIAEATERVAKRLESMGHRLEPGSMLDGTIDDFLPLMARMVANVPLIGLFSERIQPTTRWLRDIGKKVDPRELEGAHADLERRIFDWFGDFDLWLTPTIPISPPKVGSFDALDGEGVFRAAAPIGAFTAPFNVTGQPAISVPAGVTHDGCPIGVQLVGRMGSDRLLISLARQLELTGKAS